MANSPVVVVMQLAIQQLFKDTGRVALKKIHHLPLAFHLRGEFVICTICHCGLIGKSAQQLYNHIKKYHKDVMTQDCLADIEFLLSDNYASNKGDDDFLNQFRNSGLEVGNPIPEYIEGISILKIAFE